MCELIRKACHLSRNAQSYTYDANGNMLTAGNRTYTWDFDNRLSSQSQGGSTTSFGYDYTGVRVEKSGPLGITVYPFSGYQVEPDGVTIKYFKVGQEILAMKKSTWEVFFYHNDHLGGVNVTTHSAGPGQVSGTMAQIIEYDPWGKISRQEGIGDSIRRFTGHILDPESGLYYYGARYYDPEFGRFISADPFIGQPDDP